MERFNMIYFDFIVTDEDAENIFNAISNEISKMKDYILEEQCKILARTGTLVDCNDDVFSPELAWYKSRIEYLEALKSKMKNTRLAQE